MDLINDPRSVLELALNSREFKPVASRLDANSFVLKVVGKEEYFLKEVPIIQYKVIDIILLWYAILTPPPPPPPLPKPYSTLPPVKQRRCSHGFL